MHEKAIEAACDRLILVQGMTTQQMRAAIAAFLRTVEPSEKMKAEGYTTDAFRTPVHAPEPRDYRPQVVFNAMSRALAEEIDNAQG